MINQFSRTELIYGSAAMDRLKKARVAVFGIGGVGGSAAEALVRSGIGELDIIDNDRVSLTNLNRQIIATHDTVGMYKVDAARQRFLSLNPDLKLNMRREFFMPQNAGDFDFTLYDYVIDAIDTVSAKIELVLRAESAGVPIISSMGAGNKRRADMLEVADIYETSVCPLARVMRSELRKRGVRALRVVYSKEPPAECACKSEEDPGKRRSVPGSTSFVPPAAGLIIAGEVINALCKV